MNLKENMEHIKKEVSSEEIFLKGILKAERWYLRFKTPIIFIVLILVFGFLGYQFSLWYKEKQMQTNYAIYQDLLKDPNNQEKRNALKNSNSPLYDIILLSESLQKNDLETLKKLHKSQDGYIAMIAQYQSASLSKEQDSLNNILENNTTQVNALKEFLIFQKAFLLLKENKIEDAHALLAQIPIDSPIKGIARFFEHYGITQITPSNATPIQNQEISTPKESTKSNIEGIELFNGAKAHE